MYCEKCGETVSDNALFCSKCGNKVSQQQQTQQYGNLIISPTKRERIAQNQANAIACCPKCGSTSLSGNKKGFGVGKAIVGGVLTGGIGIIAGNIGAKKVRVTCLNCGKQFWAGK